jgi:porin
VQVNLPGKDPSSNFPLISQVVPVDAVLCHSISATLSLRTCLQLEAIGKARTTVKHHATVFMFAMCALISAPAHAAPKDDTPTMAVAVRETVDGWAVPLGLDPGSSILNKFQLSATLTGDKLGLKGWSAHAQIFRFDGQLLSARMGDLQTADNLEAIPITRLFEAWIARQWGEDSRSIALRAGLIDLNSQFDSVDPASLFINSSHGIAPDLSRSGRNGPSIYPVSSPGATLTMDDQAWRVRRRSRRP